MIFQANLSLDIFQKLLEVHSVCTKDEFISLQQGSWIHTKYQQGKNKNQSCLRGVDSYIFHSYDQTSNPQIPKNSSSVNILVQNYTSNHSQNNSMNKFIQKRLQTIWSRNLKNLLQKKFDINLFEGIEEMIKNQYAPQKKPNQVIRSNKFLFLSLKKIQDYSSNYEQMIELIFQQQKYKPDARMRKLNKKQKSILKIQLDFLKQIAFLFRIDPFTAILKCYLRNVSEKHIDRKRLSMNTSDGIVQTIALLKKHFNLNLNISHLIKYLCRKTITSLKLKQTHQNQIIEFQNNSQDAVIEQIQLF